MKSYPINTCPDIGGECDILITSVSFEERCTAICTYLKTKEKLKHVFLYRNMDVSVFENEQEKEACKKKIDGYHDMIDHSLEELDITCTLFESKHRNSDARIEKISEMIDKIKEIRESQLINCIAIDATCFTRIDLVVLLDYLFDCIQDVCIKIIYIRPANHAEDFLSKGYSGIESILGFAGSYDYLKKSLLVIMAGFEEERPRSFIEEYEADSILFGTSENKPTKIEFGKRTELLRSKFMGISEIECFDFSANSVYDCLNDLEKALNHYLPKYNIIIAPLCTKLSVVAAFLFAKKHQQIQLAYCYPEEYNWRAYSSGMDSVYIEDIEREGQPSLLMD